MAHKYLKLGNVLKRLLFDHNMKAIDLAREVNIPPPTIHRLITGKSTRPYKSSLQPIADFFAVTIEQLTGDELLSSNSLIIKENNTLSNTVASLPLLPWEKLPDHHINENEQHKYETIPFVGNISTKAYATILNDYSMEPLFSNGSILIFDPEKPFKDRSYVLVQLQDTNLPVFRQLLIDLDQKYLKPLNPDLTVFKMRAIGENDRIIATLVEARQIFNDR